MVVSHLKELGIVMFMSIYLDTLTTNVSLYSTINPRIIFTLPFGA